MKTLKIFKKGKFILKVEQMTRESAMEYLRYLHDLEQEYSKSLFGDEMRLLVQIIRFEFIKDYNKKGA